MASVGQDWRRTAVMTAAVQTHPTERLTRHKQPAGAWLASLLSSSLLHAAGFAVIHLSAAHLEASRSEEFKDQVAIEIVEMPKGVADEPLGDSVNDASPEPSGGATRSPSEPSSAQARTSTPTQTLTATVPSDGSDEVIDLDDVVLSNEPAADPDAIPSAGGSRSGTSAGTGSGRGSGAGSGSGGGFGSPDGTVPVSSLARKPKPPTNIRALLEKNYPKRAQRLGIEGNARISLRVGPNGRTSVFGTISETGSNGFAQACIETLRASRWEPPIDTNGQKVTTEITFTCVFEIRY